MGICVRSTRRSTESATEIREELPKSAAHIQQELPKRYSRLLLAKVYAPPLDCQVCSVFRAVWLVWRECLRVASCRFRHRVEKEEKDAKMQQDQREEVSAQLQMRYAEQEQRFRHQWFNLNFEETEIEEDWRATSFDGQRKYMYGLAVVVMIYSLFAALVYNVRAPALSAASRAPPPAAASRARRRFFRACAAR